MFTKLMDLYGRNIVLQSFVMVAFWSLLASSLVRGINVYLIVAFHEVGHILALMWYRIPIKKLQFQVFGAYVEPDGKIEKGAMSFFVYLAGPVIGSIFGIAVLLWYFKTSDFEFMLAAKICFLINLINLLPIYPMDGGMILLGFTRVLGKKAVVLQFVGTCIALVVFFFAVNDWIARPFIVLGFILNLSQLSSKNLSGNSDNSVDESTTIMSVRKPFNLAKHGIVYLFSFGVIGICFLYVDRLPI